MSFQHLIDHPDEMLFFNYMRISYQSYRDLKNLILIHITQSDQTGGPQIQEKINESNHKKKKTFLFPLREIINALKMYIYYSYQIYIKRKFSAYINIPYAEKNQLYVEISIHIIY